MTSRGRVVAVSMMAVTVLLGGTGLLASAASAAPGQLGQVPEVIGTGSGMVEGFAVDWANALQKSPAGGSLVNYGEAGSKAGREQWAKGQADFAISGRPLSAEDRQALAIRGTSAIEAPIAVSAMTFLMTPAYGAPLTLKKLALLPDGTSNQDLPPLLREWTDPVRMPNELLARIFLERSGTLANEPTFTAQIPLLSQLATEPEKNRFEVDAGVRPVVPVVRSDPGAVDYYLNQFVASSAPVALQAKATSESVEVVGASESWPFISSPSRTGDGQIAGLIAGWQTPVDASPSLGGTVGPVSPSAVGNQRFVQAVRAANGETPTPLYVLEIQNGAGSYVAPTTATITRGAELNQGKPLAQLNDPFASPDAYPLTWVSSMYVQSSGLSVDKTSIIATLIRYAVTAGQSSADQLNEGRLPPAEVSQALAAADAVVGSNCLGSDRKVVLDGTGGPYWPTGVSPPSGGTYVCVPAAAAGIAVDPTTLIPGRAPSPVATVGSSGFSSSASSGPYAGPAYSGTSNSSSAAADSFAPSDQGAVATVQPGGKKGAAALAAATLPMEPPDDGRRTLDRLSTMLLGGVALLAARSVVRRTKVAP